MTAHKMGFRLFPHQYASLDIGKNLALIEDSLGAGRDPDAFPLAFMNPAAMKLRIRFVLHHHIGLFVAKNFNVEKLTLRLLANHETFPMIIENLAAGKAGLAVLADSHSGPGIIENLALLEESLALL